VHLPALETVRTGLEQALGLRFEGSKGEHFFRSTLASLKTPSSVAGQTEDTLRARVGRAVKQDAATVADSLYAYNRCTLVPDYQSWRIIHATSALRNVKVPKDAWHGETADDALWAENTQGCEGKYAPCWYCENSSFINRGVPPKKSYECSRKTTIVDGDVGGRDSLVYIPVLGVG
jgi:hypothetical protein